MRLPRNLAIKTGTCLSFAMLVLLQSQNVQSAGECGSANKKNYITTPEGRLPVNPDLCAAGSTYVARADAPDLWRWYCRSGSNTSCSAYIARCGDDDGDTQLTAPTVATMCDPDGINDALVLTGDIWSWHCTDTEGAQASCSAIRRTNGSCGTAQSNDYVNPPSANLCTAGTPTAVVNDGADHWDWTCAGVNGGTPVSCTADIVNCGTANGTSTLSAPTSNLCSEGTVSAVTPSGDQWIWTCTDDVGTVASCSANNKDNGDCGTAQGLTYDSAPTSTTELCDSGTPSAVTDSGNRWTWQCAGTYGGTNVNCWANDSDNGACGAAISAPSEYAPTTNLCSVGTASAVSDGGATWEWICNGVNGGTAINCSTAHIVNGDCGYAQGGTYENTPTSGLCNTGVASAVVVNGSSWNWSCAGAAGGTDENCTANRTVINNYCAQPPFIVSPVEPNVMSVIDASGSMSWKAYNYPSTAVPVPVYRANEEGYFRPDKNYRYNSTAGYWEETTAGSVACPDNSHNPSTASIYKGSCLNYHRMSRMDLVRWAMTGGRPNSCTGSSTFNANQCDPELWDEPGNAGKVGAACNDTIGGCILLATNGDKVKVPWSRVWDGLTFQFKAMSLKPRMGALFYSDNTVRSAGQVYMGDFTAPNSTSGNFPYMNLITAINSTAPSGGTPTGPAMWDAFNYYKQSAPQFGGIPVQSGEGDRWKNPMYVCDGGGANCMEIPCAKNFVLLMSDGQWNSPSCSIDNWRSDPVKPAYEMHQTFTNLGTNKTTNVNATHAIGIFLGGTGEQSLENVAMYGSFNKTSGWPDSLTGYPLGECDMDDCGGDGKGSGCTTLPTSTSDWDSDGHPDVPDTFHSATNASEIKESIKNAILDMLRRSSSGTAVSVLSSSEGSGANLMQALFYPKRSFAGGKEVAWTSDLMNYWYYMDPFLSSSNIREDTIRENAAYTLLDLKEDYITKFTYDASQEKTIAYRWQDSTGLGNSLTDKGSVPIEDTSAIWRAGFNLWWTAPTSRTIFTSVDVTAATTATAPTAPTLIPFSVTNSDTIDDYLGVTGIAAKKTINYVRGYDCADATTGEACESHSVTGKCLDTAGCSSIGRSRIVSSGVCSTRKSPCSSDANCPSGETCVTETHEWKLGDIISSTPRIMGPGYLNNFNLKSPYGYNDKTYGDFIKSTDYANRQLVFVGANDGMLHAFKLGKLLQKWTGKNWYESAKQEGSTGAGGIGSESYAFIPKNVLPYLQYLENKEYCHVYMVDGPTVLTDAAINKPSTCTQADYWNCPKQSTIETTTNTVDFAKTSWRTTLIGSVGIGGATCDAAAADADRVSTPISVGGQPVGWSSYFALDVTNQADPKLLWEFSNADLGVTNVGPAIVKVGGNDKRCSISSNIECTTDTNCLPVATNGNCVSTNGRWLAILASGSTGPISNLEFKGRSDKNLKIFVLDLKTGALLKTIDTGISNAFAGSISTSALDLEKDRSSNSGNYQDDAVYIGYVQNITSGGVLRLVINDDINVDNWRASKVIDGIGPVTTSVVNLLDRSGQKLWLYFAEGRYFYKLDDLTTQRKLFGIQEPCFDATNNSIPPACTSSQTLAVLKDQTTSPNTTLTDEEKGWYIKMNAATGTMSAERVISNPTPDTLGAIYFLSFAPTSDVCSFGGTSYLWALDYKTGGQVTFNMQGKALVQVSTGEIKELNLSDALTDNDGRKSVGFKGIPPTGQGLMVVKNPDPIKKFMHVQEQ